MADIAEGETITAVFPYAASQKMLVSASDGRGLSRTRTRWSAAPEKGNCF